MKTVHRYFYTKLQFNDSSRKLKSSIMKISKKLNKAHKKLSILVNLKTIFHSLLHNQKNFPPKIENPKIIMQNKSSCINLEN
jgi:hypothetical protein